MKHALFLLAGLATAFIPRSSLAQSGEFETSYNKRFLERSPLIGKSMSDVSIFNDKGLPFSLKDAEGKYTVVVFGCLT